jgi:hypothetical protein
MKAEYKTQESTNKLYEFLHHINSGRWQYDVVAEVEYFAFLEWLALRDTLGLIGYATDGLGGINYLLENADDICSVAIEKNYIKPRDPITYLRADDLPAIRSNGDIVSPDSSWVLTFEEADLWAKERFAVSLKALREAITQKQAQTEQTQEPAKENKDSENKPMNQRERNTLLAIIAALCEKAGITPDKRGLSSELANITERLGVAKSDDRIRKYLKEAADLTK